MKVMVMVKATKESEAGEMPSTELLAAMMSYNEELVKAGIMLSGDGLHPSSKGARVRFSGKSRTVIDGPFAETKELVAGFWIWQVKSMQEAIDWVKRCPNPMMSDSDIEIRPIFGVEDFGDAMTPELQEREAELFRQTETMQLAPDRFEEGQPMRVAGLNASYSMEDRDGIPGQWEKFAPHIGRVPGQADAAAYGVCWNFNADGEFDYLCGVQIGPDAEIPPEFTEVTLPAVKYAVFVHHGHYSAIPQKMEAIVQSWLPRSGCLPAGTPCFERYTEEFNPETGKGGTEIWIAIAS